MLLARSKHFAAIGETLVMSSQVYHNRAPLSRVTSKHPCPVCGKPDWCSIFTNGQRAICMRVAAGSIKPTRGGGYIHVLQENHRPFNSHNRRPLDNYRPSPNKESTIAAVEVRHAVYSALLESSTLAARHADSLIARGISEDSITRNLYASAPIPTAIIADLARRFNLCGVPGFYQDSGKWQFIGTSWNGFFIPVRDVHGRIQAMQFRRDDGNPRYIWVSSKDKTAGASSGAPIHFSAPYWTQLNPSARVWLTEGALKADAISDQLSNTVIALAGVNSFNDNFAHYLKSALPTLSTITIAFDADSDSNPIVARALQRAAFLLHAGGFRVEIARWDGARGKGLDDVIVGLSRETAQEKQA